MQSVRQRRTTKTIAEGCRASALQFPVQTAVRIGLFAAGVGGLAGLPAATASTVSAPPRS
jgi:hypothetical protein